MRYAYHDAAFSSHYDSTIFNFQTALLGQYNPTTNCSYFLDKRFHFPEYAVYPWYSSWTWWSSPNWWLHLLWNIFKDYSSSDQTIYRHNRHFLLYVALGWLLQALLYLNSPAKYTLSIALKMFSDPSSQSDWGSMFAMSTLSIIPIFLIFLFFQKYLVEGISTEGLKDNSRPERYEIIFVLDGYCRLI